MRTWSFVGLLWIVASVGCTAGVGGEGAEAPTDPSGLQATVTGIAPTGAVVGPASRQVKQLPIKHVHEIVPASASTTGSTGVVEWRVDGVTSTSPNWNLDPSEWQNSINVVMKGLAADGSELVHIVWQSQYNTLTHWSASYAGVPLTQLDAVMLAVTMMKSDLEAYQASLVCPTCLSWSCFFDGLSLLGSLLGKVLAIGGLIAATGPAGIAAAIGLNLLANYDLVMNIIDFLCSCVDSFAENNPEIC